MSFRIVNLALVCAAGACSLFTACTYQLPMVSGNGGDGTGGATSSSGSGGAGGVASVGGSGGAAGVGGDAGAGGGMPVNWWKPAWTHRVRITFKNGDGNALNGFPVMVRLDGSRMPNAPPSPNGADLRFIDDDGQTILPHEIDSWKPSGDSFVWVQVPTIDASNTDHIWLYYGNPNAMDVQDAAKVWTNFIGVYHLSPLTGIPTQFPDSASKNPGTWFNDVPGGIVPGPISDAINLEGAASVDVGDNNNVSANPGEARTVEAWVNTAKLQEQAIVYEEGGCLGWHLSMTPAGEYLGSFTTDSVAPVCGQGSGSNVYLVSTPAVTGAWHYVVLVIDRPNKEMRLFVDGTLAKLIPIDNAETADGNGVFHIGSNWDGTGSFVGAIDEVRVSKNSRNAGWIAAQHKSMTDNFLTFTPK